MRLGLFGGRFDPPHLGHVLLAQQAIEILELDTVLFMPAKAPPHKRADATPEHRHAMALLATADHESFRVSRLELERAGPSYTFDTVQQLKRQIPHADLFLLVGADAARELASWYRPEELVRACTVVAFPRPGAEPAGLENLDPQLASRVRSVHGRLVDVSGTEVRARIAEGRSVRYLVPRPVEAYLHKHGLYGAEQPPGARRRPG